MKANVEGLHFIIFCETLIDKNRESCPRLKCITHFKDMVKSVKGWHNISFLGLKARSLYNWTSAMYVAQSCNSSFGAPGIRWKCWVSYYFQLYFHHIYLCLLILHFNLINVVYPYICNIHAYPLYNQSANQQLLVLYCLWIKEESGMGLHKEPFSELKHLFKSNQC